MIRSAAGLLVLATIVFGCTSISIASPSPSPAASPTLGITTMAPVGTPASSPTSVPTDGPTPTATAEPTDTPTDTPTDQPSPSAAASPIAGPLDFGATTFFFADDMSSSTTGWGVGDNDGGSVAFGTGVLEFTTSGEGAWLWSVRNLDQGYNVVRLEAVMVPFAASSFGLLCAASNTELYGAVVTTDGAWQFIQVTTEVTVLSSDDAAGWAVPVVQPTEIALDCAGTATGAMRLQISLPDQSVSAFYESPEGPETFDRLGAFVESAAHPFTLAVDNSFAFVGNEYTGGTMSVEATAILEHVPDTFAANCVETTPSAFETGGLAAVACSLEEPGASIVEYVQFDTQANMAAAYQQRVDNFAVEPTGSCQTGPNEASYTIGVEDAGRIMCAPQLAGIRLDWSDDRLLILSSLTDFEGSYADTFADWLEAGPSLSP